jgi:large subunit ribosomal protein L15
MTKYHQLEATKNQAKKRVGRGKSGGQGKTAGRGTKGQKSRTGKKLRATFMGGSRSLMQAVPKKRGFKSLRVPAQVIYLDQLAEFANKTADNHSLFEAGLIPTPYQSTKVITRGELTAKVVVKLQAASAGSKAAITKAGGSFEAVPVPLPPSSKPKKDK